MFDEDFDSVSREWMGTDRLLYLWETGWARLSNENIYAIVTFSKDEGIIEMGGGSGHNATLLREKGVDVISFDIGPEDFTYQETWKQSPNANGVIIDDGRILQSHTSRVLMMIWPHMGVFSSAKSNNAFLNYSKFIFVGEMLNEDNFGVCGSKVFFATLEQNGFKLVKEPQDINNFPYQYGKLLFFEKGAPDIYPIPKMSWEDWYNREVNESFEAAKYYMSVKKEEWYRTALCELRSKLHSCNYLTKDKQHWEHVEHLLTPEIFIKYKELIEECERVLVELGVHQE